ncbi:hypothetical protein T08_1962 [Trichinella sp. T8]|nr:hypothetical protein T08_1962 [Trichinella sp. T8]
MEKGYFWLTNLQTNTLAHLENWYFCIAEMKVYLKGVNDIVHNFKEHYVTCIALFVVFDLFTSTLHSLTMKKICLN